MLKRGPAKVLKDGAPLCDVQVTDVVEPQNQIKRIGGASAVVGKTLAKATFTGPPALRALINFQNLHSSFVLSSSDGEFQIEKPNISQTATGYDATAELRPLGGDADEDE